MAAAIFRLPLAFDTLRCSSHSLSALPLLASSTSSFSSSFASSSSSSASVMADASLAFGPRKRLTATMAQATVAESDRPKWWEKNCGSNMLDIHSTQEFLSALSQAGDGLVIVEFYGTWCASCRALFPKLCRTAQEHPEILFLKVNFDENKPMCKNLNVKVLPHFHFYRGADGQLESFSCSLAKFQKIKDAIRMHNTVRGGAGASKGVGDLNLKHAASGLMDRGTGSSSAAT